MPNFPCMIDVKVRRDAQNVSLEPEELAIWTVLDIDNIAGCCYSPPPPKVAQNPKFFFLFL